MAKALVNKIQDRVSLLKEEQKKLIDNLNLFKQEEQKAIARLNAVSGAIVEMEELSKIEEVE